MPKRKILTDKEREQWFVSVFINKFHADESKLAKAEKRCGLTPGTGAKILKRKSVQLEIQAYTEPIRMEQMRQKVISEAAAAGKVMHQEALAGQVSEIRRMKIDLEVLDDQVMQMAVGLDQNRFPKEKLDAIKTAYVVHGTIESGNSRRLIPAENSPTESISGIYTSLFQRLSQASTPRSEAPPEPQDVIYDLVPAPTRPTSPPERTADPSNSNVITVDVG